MSGNGGPEGHAGGPEGPPYVLEIENLVVRRQGAPILDDVSIRVQRRSLHVLVGPNGAGKSTLVAAILNQIPFDGRVVLAWSGTGTIGYVPQGLIVDPTLPVTVEDFLALTRQRMPVCFGITRAARRQVAAMLDRVGLSGLERRPLAVLSGGELRRVLLAHALDPEPELLLLDEPGAGLDEPAMGMLEAVLNDLRCAGRTTTVMVSHDLEQVQRIADRVTVLDGRVVADGPADVLAAAHVRELMPPRDRRAVRA